MTDLNRRGILAGAAAGAVALGAAAAAKAAEFGNPNRPLQGAINSSALANADPGPQNPASVSYTHLTLPTILLV